MPWILKVNKATKNNAESYLISAFQVLMETVTVKDTLHLFELSKKIVVHHHRMNEAKKQPVMLKFKVILMTLPGNQERIDLVRIIIVDEKEAVEGSPLLSILNQEVLKGENEYLTVSKR
jgi:hypothetical protein